MPDQTYDQTYGHQTYGPRPCQHFCPRPRSFVILNLRSLERFSLGEPTGHTNPKRERGDRLRNPRLRFGLTQRAAFGGTPTARELLVGGLVSTSVVLYSALRCRASVAVHTLVLRARGLAWSERLPPCHWRLAMPGSPGVVLIPLGRLQTFPISLLAHGALLFDHLHPRVGDNNGSF